jgi:PAS domain S-box-containing protein
MTELHPFLQPFGHLKAAIFNHDGGLLGQTASWKQALRHADGILGDRIRALQIDSQLVESTHWQIPTQGGRGVLRIGVNPVQMAQGNGAFLIATEDDVATGQSGQGDGDGHLLEQLMIIAEHAPLVSTLYRRDGKPIYVSPMSKNILGYEPQEIMAKPSYFGIFEEDKPGYIAYAKEVTIGKTRPEGYDFSFIKKGEVLLWIKIKMIPIYDDNGEVTHIQAINRDINQSKLQELALQQSKENALAIINSANYAILLINEEGVLLSTNDMAKILCLNYFNRSLTEGAHMAEIKPLFHDPVYQEGYKRALGGQVFSKYIKPVLRNGSKDIWLHFKFIPVWSAQGKVNAVNFTVTDVTEEKKVEQYSISLLERLNLANGAGEIGIWEYDFETRLVRFDDQCLVLFDNQIGVKATGVNWAMHYQKADRLGLIKMLDPIAHAGKAQFNIEMELDRPFGKIQFHRIKGRILFKDGIPRSATGVLLDISSAKSAERRMQHTNEQLDQAHRLAGLGSFEYEVEAGRMHWSDNTYDLHGIPQGKMPSLRHYLRQVDEEDGRKLLRVIDQATASNALQKTVYRYRADDGREITFNLRLKGVFYRNKLVKITGSMQDISDNMNLRKSLQNTESQLMSNKKRLSEYSFMNSHKVRAPLSNILGIIQLLRLEHNPEMLEMLERSAEELDKVIHEVNAILAE